MAASSQNPAPPHGTASYHAGPVEATPFGQLGNYQLLDQIGKGGMGAVFRAMHTKLKRIVALKVLPEEKLQDRMAVERFYREMEAIGRLEHPHLVRATDAGSADQRHYLVMECLEGQDLQAIVSRVGPLPMPEACEVVRQAALGLAYVDANGLVHRDIKPSNLFLTRQGQIKVLDLGLALITAGPRDASTLTGDHQTMGTLDYMAPEQWTNCHQVDARADIYSLGCTLYKLLTGVTPWKRAWATGIQPSETPIDPRERRPDLPEELAALILRMLTYDRTQRISSCTDVATALASFAKDADLLRLLPGPQPETRQAPVASTQETGSVNRATVAGEPSPPTKPRPWPRRRVLTGSILAAMLLTVGIVALIAFRGDRTDPDEPPPVEKPTPPPVVKPTLRPGLWNDLFVYRKPEPLVWPTGIGDSSHWFLNEKTEELICHCDNVGIIGLAEVGAVDYSFSISLKQTTWTGGIGIVFGYQASEHDGKKGHRYQLLELRRYRQGNPDQAFALWRRAEFRWLDTKGDGHFETLLQAAEPLPLPMREAVLEFSATKTGLTQVRWDGKELFSLTNPKHNLKLSPNHYVGHLGTFSFLSTGVFRNPRLLFKQRSAP